MIITVKTRSISNSAKHINCSRNRQRTGCNALYNGLAVNPCENILTYCEASDKQHTFRIWDVPGSHPSADVLQGL